MIKLLSNFIKSTSSELNPWKNIKILHTNIKGDVLSGIMVAIIALPLALAFGEISRLGPEAGIWSAIVGGIVGGLFGGCLVGVSGPTAPMASQIAMFMGVFVIGTTNEPDLVAAFSIIFLSGLILVFISILKISRFIHYIPYSVISGFMCGIGAIVILTQINSFVGLEAEKNIYDIFKNFRYTIQNINVHALYVAIPCLLILFLWDFLQKRFKSLLNIPSPLAALIIGTSIAFFMNLSIPYIGDKMNIAEQSKIFTFYFPDLSRISEFIIPAFLLAGLAVIDSLLSCKVADNMTGLRHSSDRETFGQGMANMSAGLLGGISTATATTQTVGNIEFGAKTPLSTIVKGLTLLGVLLGLGYLLAAIPNACLAAILFKLGIDILDYRILPVLRKIPISDLFIFIIVLFVTVYQNLMVAVALGVIIAILKSLNKLISRSNYKYKMVSILDSDFVLNQKQKKELDGLSVKVLKLNGPLFFGSTEQLINVYNNAPNHKVLIIDMSIVSSVDLTGIYSLEDIVKGAQSNGIITYVSNANQNIKQVMNNVDFIKNIGKEYYEDSTESVILQILENNNQNI
ncbi:MAG: hypothetical protein CMG14_06250 [Candidatus Marinimicrobia bacterium]|nr:hypothetical protein [Candidatus Neomarinimicrobiota bacterium]|tara:strand:- start:58001 stop:59716 length:1716 start_codon:yes stop_codon:yes gene_type:complete